jgi:hypothetical protein
MPLVRRERNEKKTVRNAARRVGHAGKRDTMRLERRR